MVRLGGAGKEPSQRVTVTVQYMFQRSKYLIKTYYIGTWTIFLGSDLLRTYHIGTWSLWAFKSATKRPRKVRGLAGAFGF